MTNDYEDLVLLVTRTSPFTNWSAHRLHIWGRTFPTVEHAFHYQKYLKTNEAWAEKIRKAPSPWLAKRLAWEHPIDTREWNQRRESIMRQLIAAKVEQHEDVRDALFDSENQAIIENGDTEDKFWGVGKGHDGENTLGKIWMRLRSNLLASE